MNAVSATILALISILPGPILAQAANNAITTDTLFDDRVLHEVRITMDPADWETMRAKYLDSTYYHMTFQYQDIVVTNVGVKLRGTASRNPIKPSLHVKFDNYVAGQTFLGLSELELKAQVQDASMIKEMLNMKLFQRAGIPAPRESESRMSVNADYKGVYTIIESVNDDFLDRVYGNHNGYLYKFQGIGKPYHFEDLGSDINKYVPAPFELRNHKSDPPPNTIADMVQAMNRAPDEQFSTTMSRYIDWKEFLSYIAIDNYLAQYDGFLSDQGMNNLFLYQLPNTNLIIFIPWDKDLSFFWDSDIFRNMDTNVFSRRALQVPDLRAIYLESLVKNGVMTGRDRGWMQNEVVRLSNLIRDAVFEDPFRLCNTLQPCTNDDFETAVAFEIMFLGVRGFYSSLAAEQAGFQLSEAGPRISDDKITNSASGEAYSAAAGTLLSAYGNSLAAETGRAAGYPLSYVLAGAEVYVNGFRAPLLYASPDQLNLQLPYSMGTGFASFTVITGGTLGNSVDIELKEAAPGLFLAAHLGGTSVSEQDPAVPGETLVIYATGLGPVNLDIPDGEPTPSSPRVTTLEPVLVVIGGEPAEVQSSYLTPGLLGIYEVHATVPQSAGTGKAPLVVNSSGIDSAPISIDINASRPLPQR